MSVRPPRSAEALPLDRRRWWVLAVIGVAQLMVVLDATIVNIALPSAQHDLGFSDSDRQWVVTAYSLAFGSLLLVGGRLADLFGHKRVFLVGVTGFAVASALAGAAGNFELLIVGRALQGVFGAILSPSALTLLNVTFTEGKERAKALGVFGAIAGTGGAIGLLLGGLLTEHLSWRWTLYVNLAFAALALVGGALNLHRTERGAKPILDLPGTALVSAGLFCLVYGLSKAESNGWDSAATWGLLPAGAALIAAFAFWQTRSANPLLPLRILRDRDRAASFTAVLVAASGMFGIFLFLTYYLQITLGYSPVSTGVAFLPMIGSLIVSAQISTNLTVRRLGPRIAVPAGMLLAAAGLAWLTGIGLDTPYASHVLPPLLIIGLGLGHVVPPALGIATAGVAPTDIGAASATVNTMQQVGGSIGTALLNTLAASAATAYLADHTPSADALAQAQLHSFTTAFWWSACIFALGAVITAFLYRSRSSTPAQPHQETAPEPMAAHM
ncbi:MFS transporter [Streptomyces sp. NBC_01334]|uniref:MFS transporter n=1 Tax=Streptomyces sp. NBC_01334 TaxID=2903827 RepID=UPI002E11BD5A|nr:MFS transporter [Streptomyces sp. NBC_01334]